jgi:ribonucleoside-triphosphate reductase (formate)
MSKYDINLDHCRSFHPGMGQAVAERTILRKKKNGEWENWGDVAERVALGNSLLCPDEKDREDEFKALKYHIGTGNLLMSGRHLQHGDETQPNRPQEVFSNCATSSTSFALFYLLLNGSGVGRCYDDDMMLVNWDYSPNVRCVLNHEHPDFDWSAHESLRDAKHKYGSGRDVMWFEVPDSREGWAKALEIWENAAFQKVHANKILILDFSKVRPFGSPIGGMQNRPSSGPVSLMNAFHKASTLKGAGLERWKQAMYIDHCFAECVLVGGARRAARMSTKTWKDPSVLDFITVKRPIEYNDLKMDEIIETRNKGNNYIGFLWSSNNSVTVDEEFWKLNNLKRKDPNYNSNNARHARKVFRLLTEASYADGTGEPGIINVDKLVRNDTGWEELTKGDYIGSTRYQLEEESELYISRLAKKAKKKNTI